MEGVECRVDGLGCRVGRAYVLQRLGPRRLRHVARQPRRRRRRQLLLLRLRGRLRRRFPVSPPSPYRRISPERPEATRVAAAAAAAAASTQPPAAAAAAASTQPPAAAAAAAYTQPHLMIGLMRRRMPLAADATTNVAAECHVAVLAAAAVRSVDGTWRDIVRGRRLGFRLSGFRV